MQLALSTLLLAFTWVLWWLALAGVGQVFRMRARPLSVRRASWLGLFAVTLLSMILALLVPLGNPLARTVGWSIVVVGVAAAIVSGLWRRWRLILLITALAVITALMSSVLPSNYDLGLYHAGAISYVREGGTVVGLANLHDRFGFSSSMWPLSAFLGLGLWDSGEYRLVNGLLILLIAGEAAVRFRSSGRRDPSAILVLFSAVLLLGAVAHYPGRLVASSAQDWAVAALMVVSATYLLDALPREASRAKATTAVLIAAMAGAMRPTGWVFAVVTLLILGWVTLRSRGISATFSRLLPGVFGLIALGSATAIRDLLSSGWLLFPARYFPLPVDWRYPDPEGTSAAITAWARTPFQDPSVTLADSSWITNWLLRLPADWGFFSFLVLGVGVILCIAVLPSARTALWRQRRVVALGIAPSVAVLAAWIVVAPDPRFAWGPLLLVVLVPLSVLVSERAPDRTLGLAALAGIAIVVFAVGRGSLSEMTLQLHPLPIIDSQPVSLNDGSSVLVPSQGDQCWGEFPLCRPWYSDPRIELRGADWRSGFQPMSRLIESQE